MVNIHEKFKESKRVREVMFMGALIVNKYRRLLRKKMKLLGPTVNDRNRHVAKKCLTLLGGFRYHSNKELAMPIFYGVLRDLCDNQRLIKSFDKLKKLLSFMVKSFETTVKIRK